MRKTTYLLITIFMMHMSMVLNVTVFEGNYNGIVMAVNTVLLIFAFGLVLPQNKKGDN